MYVDICIGKNKIQQMMLKLECHMTGIVAASISLLHCFTAVNITGQRRHVQELMGGRWRSSVIQLVGEPVRCLSVCLSVTSCTSALQMHDGYPACRLCLPKRQHEMLVLWVACKTLTGWRDSVVVSDNVDRISYQIRQSWQAMSPACIIAHWRKHFVYCFILRVICLFTGT